MDINKNNTNSTCPGCGRHCDLSSPHCPTGREYAETGKLPEGGGHHHHEHHEHREPRDLSSMTGDEKLLHLLRLLGRTLSHSAEPTGGQDRVLKILSEKDGIGQKELMDMLGIKAGSVSELLGKLENAGMITRQKNETDHRAVNVFITDAGREKAASSAGSDSSDLLAALTAEEKQQLTVLLEKLTADWQQKFAPQGKGHRGHRQQHEHGHSHEHGHKHGHEQHHEHHHMHHGRGEGR